MIISLHYMVAVLNPEGCTEPWYDTSCSVLNAASPARSSVEVYEGFQLVTYAYGTLTTLTRGPYIVWSVGAVFTAPIISIWSYHTLSLEWALTASSFFRTDRHRRPSPLPLGLEQSVSDRAESEWREAYYTYIESRLKDSWVIVTLLIDSFPTSLRALPTPTNQSMANKIGGSSYRKTSIQWPNSNTSQWSAPLYIIGKHYSTANKWGSSYRKTFIPIWPNCSVVAPLIGKHHHHWWIITHWWLLL